MFEHKNQKPLSTKKFLFRIATYGKLIFDLVVFSLLVGVAGYHYFEQMPFVDALLNASMILGGMGPADQLHTENGKIFASFYALYSGLFLIASTAIILVPIIHRMLHKFHSSDVDAQ